MEALLILFVVIIIAAFVFAILGFFKLIIQLLAKLKPYLLKKYNYIWEFKSIRTYSKYLPFELFLVIVIILIRYKVSIDNIFVIAGVALIAFLVPCIQIIRKTSLLIGLLLSFIEAIIATIMTASAVIVLLFILVIISGGGKKKK